MKKQRVILKLTGEIVGSHVTTESGTTVARAIIQQIQQLSDTHQFGIVIGGGNFFRGSQHGKQLTLTPAIADHVGMIATIMNGLIIQDMCTQIAMKATLFSAIHCPQIAREISPQSLEDALHTNSVLIFTGGTGNPFFTTDTSAILRALQINAAEIWKATNVDGIYTTDPRTTQNAQLLKKVTYKEALEKKLEIMDTTAYALAEQHKKIIRVFKVSDKDALLNAAQDKNFGSIIEL